MARVRPNLHTAKNLHEERKKLSPCFTDHKKGGGIKFDYVASNMT